MQSGLQAFGCNFECFLSGKLIFFTWSMTASFMVEGPAYVAKPLVGVFFLSSTGDEFYSWEGSSQPLGTCSPVTES